MTRGVSFVALLLLLALPALVAGGETAPPEPASAAARAPRERNLPRKAAARAPAKTKAPRVASGPARPRAVPAATEAGAVSAPAESAVAAAPSEPTEQRPAAGRVVAPAHAAALFARHSWYVPPPPKPEPAPPPPPPPPQPTAPPLPFTFVGSYAPAGQAPVFFLSRAGHVVDARVGDRLDGVYQLESAGGGQLTFLYLPLGVRQGLAGGSP